MKSKLAGCTIDFNPQLKLKLKEQIGAGSFSYVYSATDSRYVVKMINSSDAKSLASYTNEKFAFQNIPKHENIINCPAYKDVLLYKGVTYCCLVLEYCPRGSIINMMVDRKIVFQETQILQIFLDVLLGLHQMHTLPQPIAHRDLKGENVLFGEDGRFKLTDFGSVSAKRFFQITENNRDPIQDDLDKNTTPTIRAPEQCDLYSGYPITEKVDIWGLGCLLYILCFQKQPFETKLSTINCQYFMNESSKYSKKTLALFPLIFVTDPRRRPDTNALLSYFEANIYSLPKGLNLVEKTQNSGSKSARSQRTPKNQAKEEKYISSLGDFGKSNMPPEFNTGSGGSKIKPSIVDVWQKYIKTLTTKTEAWILSVLEENEDSPNQKFMRFLIIKAWQKPHKIKKFYVLLHKKFAKNQESTIIAFKALILLHNYLKKGPNDAYFQASSANVAYPKDLLSSIHDMWKLIFGSNLTSSRDKIRDPYTSNIIVEYSHLVSRKVDLIRRYFKIIEGNYSLNPFFNSSGEENNPLTVNTIQDLLDYLQCLIDFHKIILLKKNLWKIQCSATLSLLDEEYCLISLLTHLIAAFKISTNYSVPQADKENVKERTQRLEDKYISCYGELEKAFENSTKMDGFQEYKNIIPTLPKETVPTIQSMPILQDYQNKKFLVKNHLSPQKSIYGLKIPASYGTLFKDIDLNGIVRNEEDFFEVHEALSASERYSNQGQAKSMDNVEQNVRTFSKSVVPPSRPQAVQLEQRNERFSEFRPDFDAFNKGQDFQNFQNFEEAKSSHQADLFAGFNFNSNLAKEDKGQITASEVQANFQTEFYRDSQHIAGSQAERQSPFEKQDIKSAALEGPSPLRGSNADAVGQNKPEPVAENYVERAENHSLEEQQYEETKPAADHNTVEPDDVEESEDDDFKAADNNSPLTLDQAITNVDQVFSGLVTPENNRAYMPGVGQANEFYQQDQFANAQISATPIDRADIPRRSPHQAYIQGQEEEEQKTVNPSHPRNIPNRRNVRAILMEKEQKKQNTRNEAYYLSNTNDSPEKADVNPDYVTLNSPEKVFDEDKSKDKSKLSSPDGSNPPGYTGFDSSTYQSPEKQEEAQNKIRNFPQIQYNAQVEDFDFEVEAKRLPPANFNKINMMMSENLQGDDGIEPERSISNPSKDDLSARKNVTASNQMKFRQHNDYQSINLMDDDEFNPNDHIVRNVNHDNFTFDVLRASLQGADENKENDDFRSIKRDHQAQREQGYWQNSGQVNLMDYQSAVKNESKEAPESNQNNKPSGESNIDEPKKLGNSNQLDVKSANKVEQVGSQEVGSAKSIQSLPSLDQEINSASLKNFIHNEVSKNIADWIIDYKQLKFLEQIGVGGSAQVYKGIWRGSEVAIKKMNLEQLSETRRKEFEREISALMKLRPHNNLVNFMGVSLHENDLCIITELCSGATLFEWLHIKKDFIINWQQKIKIALDVARGMNYLHTCDPPIIHRDLKSLNLLLNEPLEEGNKRFTVKIADFGMAKAEDLANQEMKTGLMGTFHWMAPEIFDNKVYTVRADVYSYGVVLWEVITRETPYPELKSPIEIMRYVCFDKQRPDMSKIPESCPNELIDIMLKCWSHEPQDRPNFAEILEKLNAVGIPN